MSKAFSIAELNYDMYDKELLVIVVRGHLGWHLVSSEGLIY